MRARNELIRRYASLMRNAVDGASDTRRLAAAIRAVLAVTMATPLIVATDALAQTTVGPGTYTTPVNVASGTTTIVGNTTLNVAGTATNVTGGTLLIDMRAGSRPGAITVRSGNYSALYANGGAIQVPNGINIITASGAAVYANGSASLVQLTGGNVTATGNGYAAVASGGTVTIRSTTYNDPFLSGGTGRGNGFVADAGGTVNLQGGNTLYTSGSTAAVALGASNAGSSINNSGALSVTMGGTGSLGAYLYNGGQLTTSAPVKFTFNGTSSVGLTVDRTTMGSAASGLSMTFNNTTGVGGTGVVVMNGGSAKLDSLTITGPGTGLGVWVQSGSSATLTGNSTIDINSLYNGQSWKLVSTTLNGGLIQAGTATSQRAGLLNQGGTIVSTGTTIHANSPRGPLPTGGNVNGSVGVYTGATGTVLSSTTLINNTINANAAGTIGLQAYTNGQYDVSGSTITNQGGMVALYLWGYGDPASPSNQRATYPSTMTFSNSTVTATGGADGLYSVNQTKGLLNAVSFSGGGLSSDTDAIYAQGPLQFTASNGATISGSHTLLYAAGQNSVAGNEATVVNLDATGGSRLSGLVEADSASVANVTLTDQSSWIGEAFYATNVNVDATSAWTIPASSIVSGQLTNNGLVQFTSPQGDSYKSLYVHSYTGAGTLGINTHLGDDASPTDRLIIDGGTATGSSRIAVTNIGGPGAETSANGILIVQTANGGTTAQGAFALSAPVIAGPYEYLLERGGATAGTENDWFLRNTAECTPGKAGCAPAPEPPAPPVPPPPAPAPAPAPSPSPAPAPAPAPDPSNPPAPPVPPPPPPVPDPIQPESEGTPVPVAPIYRPEVSLYTALPGMALRYGWATLDNLHERMGEEEQLRGRSDLRQDNVLNALWVRVMGEDGNVRGAAQGIYNGSPQYDYNIAAFQAGMDVFAQEHDNQQRDHAGLYLGTGRIRSDVTDYDGSDAGRDVVKGQSLGLYWTHFWNEGAYLDAVWQGSWSKWSAMSNEGLELHRSGFGWAASLEGGYPFHDDSQVWEPQAQVIYQKVNSGQASDAAASVDFSHITSLVGRAGLRWANTWTLEPTGEGIPRLFTGWLRLNLWKEFKGQPTTSFSSEEGFVPFDGNIKGSWWQLNGGMTWQLDKNTSFYANLGYQKGFSSRGFHAWDGKVGFRWNW